MAKDDRDIGFNIDSDPEPEVTVYDDDLARKLGFGALVLGALYVLNQG